MWLVHRLQRGNAPTSSNGELRERRSFDIRIYAHNARAMTMEGETWRAVLLQLVLLGSIMSMVMGWVHRSRFRRRPASEAHVLVLPPSVLIIGLLCFVFFAAAAIVSNVIANKTTTWWTTSIFVGFALLALIMLYGYFFERHEISEEGLIYRRITGVKSFLVWSDLRAVRYSRYMNWFRLETNSGNVARVSVMLMGLPEFARLLLRTAPRDSIEAATLNLLRVIAFGSPPSVWT
jgi:hypothetical protein